MLSGWYSERNCEQILSERYPGEGKAGAKHRYNEREYHRVHHILMQAWEREIKVGDGEVTPFPPFPLPAYVS